MDSIVICHALCVITDFSTVHACRSSAVIHLLFCELIFMPPSGRRHDVLEVAFFHLLICVLPNFSARYLENKWRDLKLCILAQRGETVSLWVKKDIATGGLTEALFSSRFALTSRIDIFLQSYVCICIQPVWDTISDHRSVSNVSCAKMERGSSMVIQVNNHTAHYSFPLLPTYS